MKKKKKAMRKAKKAASYGSNSATKAITRTKMATGGGMQKADTTFRMRSF